MSIISGVITPDQYTTLENLSSDINNKNFRESQELDKDAFLKLMMTQLQYQDPLDPMDNTQYIAQMAQFSSVEQLSNIASTMEKNNTLTTTMSNQIFDLSKLIESMNENMTGVIENTASSDDEIAQNKAILDELMKLNESMEAYMSSQDASVSNEDILNAILG
jgi:flagellar basal-body rod modification protein FlgD